ncbi:MAG: DUF805 domain-containing protein [Pseudomonadota bacterium]
MLDAIKYSLANLGRIEGRDSRGTFWYYVLFLVILQFVVGLIVSLPIYISMFTVIFDATASGGDPNVAMQGMFEDLVSQIRSQMAVSMIVGVVIGLMLIASFVRRLHDAGYTGWIVLVPLATQAFSIIYAYTFMDRMGEIMLENMTAGFDGASGGGPDPFALQAEMGCLGLVGWIGYIVVIGFGVLKSQEGPNQYGEGPVRF